MEAFTAKGAYPTMTKVAKAPIGSIRVRVDGGVGIDALSRERVRKVAQAITDGTGLSVDIVVGSSPTPVAVDLPAGSTAARPSSWRRAGSSRVWGSRCCRRSTARAWRSSP